MCQSPALKTVQVFNTHLVRNIIFWNFCGTFTIPVIGWSKLLTLSGPRLQTGDLSNVCKSSSLTPEDLDIVTLKYLKRVEKCWISEGKTSASDQARAAFVDQCEEHLANLAKSQHIVNTAGL